MDDIFGIDEVTLFSRVYRLRNRYPGRITADELRHVIERSNGKCCWCNKDVRGRDLTIEHFAANNDPMSLGVACYSCNSSHKTGHKTRADVPEDVLEHRKNGWLKTWEKENAELQRAIRRREYLRNKDGYIKRYLEANRTRILADQKRYREENRDTLNAKWKQWRDENKEDYAARRRQWREANPNVVKQRWAAYSEQHREELAAKEAARAAKRDSDPEKRAEHLAKRKERYQANAAQRRADAKAYVAVHRDEINAKKREKRAALKAVAASAGQSTLQF